PYYVDVIARDNGRDVTLLAAGNSPGGNNTKATFDLSAATVGSVTDSGNFADGAAIVTDLGGGWVRCALTGTTDSSVAIQIFVQLNDGTESYTGDGSSGIHVYSHSVILGSSTAPSFSPATGAVNGALIHVEAAQTEAGLDSSPPVSELAMYAIEDDLSAHHNHGFRMWLDAPESYRWWRVTIIDDNNADAFVDVGRLGLWNAWRPARNMKAGWSIGYVEPDGDNRRQREVKFDFHYETKADMLGQAMLLDRARGTKRDVVFVADPSEASDAYPHESFVYGTITDMRAVVSDASLLWHKGYTMQEILP
ncbi:MAG TPA: hypothetical protein VM487_21355, partial [Phycisphaerae bacterium]|nr:hypothetical protein [Phycisphaerae bacterium]